MKSLLIVSCGFGHGGAERSIELLVQELQNRVRLTLLVENDSHLRVLAGIVHAPTRLIAMPKSHSSRRIFLLSFFFIPVYLRARPDAVVTNTQASAAIVAGAARFVPGLVSRTWLYVRDYQWRRPERIFRRLPTARILTPDASVLAAPGYVKPHVHPSRCFVVPDMTVIPASVPDYSESTRYVLHLANRHPCKGHFHLIRTAESLRDTGRTLHFISRGHDQFADILPELTAQIATAGLQSYFELGGYIPDPAPLLHGCLCVVISTVSAHGGPETFGRTLIEAWAHGRPVVAFAVGAPGRLIQHEHDGLLVPEGDERALADALWRLHSDPALARRLGENGLAKVRAHYELRRVADQFLDTLGLRSA